METWFLNHVLGLSLSVLLLGLPGPLRAGTPNNSSTEPGTNGFYYSTTTNELGDMEYNETSTSHSSSESLSPSQRNLLLTHTAETHTAAAGNFDTEQTETFTETSSRSLETVRLSTEPLTSTLVAATTEASPSSSGSSSSSISSSSISSSSISSSSSSSNIISSSSDWRSPLHTDQLPDVSPVVSQKTESWMTTEDSSMPQDSPDSTLRMGDAVSLASQTAVLTDSTYTSTTISRAGERTLLSVTSSSNNSTSSAFTEDSNSHQPPSTWGVPATGGTDTEDYTHSAPSTRTDSRDTTDQHMTRSFGGTNSETGSQGVSRGTQTLTGPPNATQHEQTSISEGTSDSTPPLRVTEPSTDQSEVSVSSTTPVISPVGGPTKMSGTDQGSGSSVGSSTESSTGAFSSSTQNQGGTEGISSQTREKSVTFSLTTAPPTVSSTTTNLDNSLTETPVLATDLLTTTVVTVTERFQTMEEETFKATASTTTTPLLPATSSSRISSTSSISTPGSPTQATVLYTTPSTTTSTLGQQTSAVHSTHRLSPSQTQGPSTGVANPTKDTTLQRDTSTGTLRVTTAHSQHITTTYTHSTPTRSTEAQQTTRKQTDRGTTEAVVTPSFRPTKTSLSPGDPCVSNPCMNGAMCNSYEGHQYTCKCQQGWSGPNCNQDVNECEESPCPEGSTCVNTNGSFNCKCPIGFDLEDGRKCTRVKTFLGTFFIKILPQTDLEKRSSMHELIQLLNASLSVLRGYRHSILSDKEKNGAHISAVNIFSISTDVTSTEVNKTIQMSISNCTYPPAFCGMVRLDLISYHADEEGRLCSAQKIQCDTERSKCTDISGTAQCQCLQGYYKHIPDDLSCLECGDGFKLENGTCVPCMFGFGGFNCGNFYKLIAVVVSPAGGVLLLILIIALIVTCCKRDKNDINKIIFKSGDLQMSPYADFPKNNRISMEWGRETIEMQENGSTKNLLQMTDIYYSPALRNSDLDRNGLYPFTGLPGSRHSCIYPAQWNPSFISDDSRRRDYF